MLSTQPRIALKVWNFFLIHDDHNEALKPLVTKILVLV